MTIPRALAPLLCLFVSACAATVVDSGGGEYYGHEEAVPLHEPLYNDGWLRQSECEHAAFARYPRRMERRCITRRRGKQEVRECSQSGYDINEALRHDYVEHCLRAYRRY